MTLTLFPYTTLFRSENLEAYSLDKIHADKWLTPERIRELAEMREQRIQEEKNQPVQLSLPLDVLFP